MEHVRLGVDYETMGEEKENVVQIGHPEERVNSVKEGSKREKLTFGSHVGLSIIC